MVKRLNKYTASPMNKCACHKMRAQPTFIALHHIVRFVHYIKVSERLSQQATQAEALISLAMASRLPISFRFEIIVHSITIEISLQV